MLQLPPHLTHCPPLPLAPFTHAAAVLLHEPNEPHLICGEARLRHTSAVDLGSDQQICGAGSLRRAQLKHEHRVGVQTTWGERDERHLPVVSLGLIKRLQSCPLEAWVGMTSREEQEGGEEGRQQGRTARSKRRQKEEG